MADFTYITGDQNYEGEDGNDRFNIYGPDDTEQIYTVIANGLLGDDGLAHIDRDPINIIFNAGGGQDYAEFLFGNIFSNYDLNMGSGDDQVIIGSSSFNGLGNYTIRLGSGQDEVIVYDVDANINILDFEAGDTGDRIVLNDVRSIQSLANGENPFSDGIFTLIQSGDHVLLEVRPDVNTGLVTQTIRFENTSLTDFTYYNFGGLSLDSPTIEVGNYDASPEIISTASLASFYGSLGDDIINVQLGQFNDVYGLSGDDIITGNSDNNSLHGGAGNDILNGNDGRDVLYYEVGGNDELNGGAGNDRFNIFPSALSGLEERFTIIADGGSGNDSLVHIDGLAHDLTFLGEDGDDEAEILASHIETRFTFDMGSGDDIVKIGADNKQGEGHYVISLGSGNDIIEMNSLGISIFAVTAPLPIQIRITDFESGADGDSVSLNFANSIGNWDIDSNPFDVGAARILQRGNDTVLQFEHFEISSGSLTNTVIQWADVMIFENLSAYTLTSENFNGLSLTNAFIGDPMTIFGTENSDVIQGNVANDSINGEAGNDVIYGNYGNDTLNGGSQNDILYGEDGNDILLGGLGVDTLYGGTGSDLVLGGNRNDTLFGENGNDRTFGGNGDDQIDGGNGNDIMRGGTGVDTLNGGEGNDTIFGGTGIDQLFGDAGNDILFGRGGFDVLTGGAGDDILTGGFNADRFIFADGFGNDTITDFAATSNAEKIDLGGVSEITDFADLLANHLSQSGTDAIIDDGLGNTITLAGVDINDLDAVDFVF